VVGVDGVVDPPSWSGQSCPLGDAPSAANRTCGPSYDATGAPTAGGPDGDPEPPDDAIATAAQTAAAARTTTTPSQSRPGREGLVSLMYTSFRESGNLGAHL
jgi:hypothetical protein